MIRTSCTDLHATVRTQHASLFSPFIAAGLTCDEIRSAVYASQLQDVAAHAASSARQVTPAATGTVL